MHFDALTDRAGIRNPAQRLPPPSDHLRPDPLHAARTPVDGTAASDGGETPRFRSGRNRILRASAPSVPPWTLRTPWTVDVESLSMSLLSETFPKRCPVRPKCLGLAGDSSGSRPYGIPSISWPGPSKLYGQRRAAPDADPPTELPRLQAMLPGLILRPNGTCASGCGPFCKA